ncbi:uncharacterized protein N7459_005126 [Penicillium hispanicum]|uniref:uncharacterized protein n=1 Tax=Penicillium hispanicum TaxID=1080232 RepID=UPI0025423296|nr:uncharacterized protein N7459_005126 [Penicillium hispanicum]KAJ5585326.1 hypothetical protein N7459_005126 [Penicillium hispanicum]
MLGLGNYDSSSEDEVEVKPSPVPQPAKKPPVAVSQANQTKAQVPVKHSQGQPPSIIPPSQAPSGPVLGPASIERTQSPEGLSAGGRSSPFSMSRALVQDLTLPPVPNLDIPPSPPGSPDPAANAKFEHFLALKKQGVHFNAKLATSSSLKNPSLLMKMMEHAGIDEQSQYDTSLPAELWSTSSLPSWGFKEELLRSQQETRQKTEDKKTAGQRSAIEFVAGSPANPSRSAFGSESKKKVNA